MLDAEPQNADALHLLGVALHQRGAHEPAADLMERADRVAPARPDILSNLSLAYRALGRDDMAERSLRHALRLAPHLEQARDGLTTLLRQKGRLAEAAEAMAHIVFASQDDMDGHRRLGLLLSELGRPSEAVKHLFRAAALNPGNSGVRCDLAGVLHAAGRNDEAERIYREALQVDPRNAEASNNLGGLLHVMRRDEEAEGFLRAAIAIAPDSGPAHVYLGAVLKSLGRMHEAKAVLERALDLAPENAHAHCNYAAVLLDLGRIDEAEGFLRRALALRPEFPEAHNDLGCVYLARGQFGLAEESFRKAVQIRAGFVDASNNLAEALKNTGRIEEAEKLFRVTLALPPDNAWVFSNWLSTLNYLPGVTLARLAEAHAEFARRFETPLRSSWRPHTNAADPERTLRVGFVSADLGYHPIGLLMFDLVGAVDRRSLSFYVYSSRHAKDDLTQKLRHRVERWRDVEQMSDSELAEQIRRDQIDVLFDLSGHTGFNRLLTFARKPAPVQVTWMGYACTTGLRAIDYLITDGDLVPPEFERFYAETVVRLPGGAVCFRLPDDLPPVGSLPALRNGFVTFGCFNNPAKVSRPTIALWGRILGSLQTSRLVLKYVGFDDSGCRERYSRLFAEGGIDPSRVTFLGRTPMDEMFARYNEVDMSLDPFPYTGGTTTFLALAMGVPVVTLVGETMASRQSYASLRRIGVVETIAASEDEYVERALALGRDLPRLAALRGELRGRLLRSPMFDAPGSARVLERAVRELWRRWCANPGLHPGSEGRG